MPPNLPPDDDGPADGELVCGPSMSTVPVKKPRGKKAKSKSQKGKSSEPPVEVTCWPIQSSTTRWWLGHLDDIFLTGGKTTCSKAGGCQGKRGWWGETKEKKNWEGWWQGCCTQPPEFITRTWLMVFLGMINGLKDAAARFPSIVEMPFLDLAPMYFGQTPPLSNHDRCDLWEISYAPTPVCPGLDPALDHLVGNPVVLMTFSTFGTWPLVTTSAWSFRILVYSGPNLLCCHHHAVSYLCWWPRTGQGWPAFLKKMLVPWRGLRPLGHVHVDGGIPVDSQSPIRIRTSDW